MVLNFRALDGQVVMAKRNPEMRAGIGERFSWGFKKAAFELAQHDPVIYYALGSEERYWIELLYSGWQNVVDGPFDDDAQRLRNADLNAGYLLTCMKNRDISKRLILNVSPDHLRRYIRERLPGVAYVDIAPPRFFERLRRKLAD